MWMEFLKRKVKLLILKGEKSKINKIKVGS